MSRFDRTNAFVAGGVLLLTFLVYRLTAAPTVSFWDCGEFVACGYILGIPHPPGTPLYILAARIFSMLPIASDLAARVNLLSAVSSAVAAMFCYLIGVRLLRAWMSEDTSRFARIMTYAGAACGALVAAFSVTTWNNSIEAEVYGMSMLLTTVVLWLGLRGWQDAGGESSHRAMYLAVFLAFLGIGVHMSTFLIFPAVMLFFMFRREASQRTIHAVAVHVALVLYWIFVLSSRPGELPWYLPVAVLFVVFLFYIFSFERIPRLFLWGAISLGVCVVPLAVDLVRMTRGLPSNAVSSAASIAGVVGGIAAVALGVWSWLKSLSGRTPAGHRRSYRIMVAFVGAAVVMVLLLYFPKGYYSFLILAPVAAAAVLVWRRRDVRWPLAVATAGVSLIVLGMREFAFGLVGALLVVLILGLVLKQDGWKAALMVVLMAVAGFSVHLFIPIRSAQQPAINENNPSASLGTLVSFLERKQYGSMPMVERMFQRRAEWIHQFGDYPRMGFWRFFQAQYGLVGPAFVVLLLLGTFGLWELLRRHPWTGHPFLILLLLSTIGLLLYMNFADGTKQAASSLASDHLEVRDRDYFFTPGFFFFGLAIGIGIAQALHYLRDSLKQRSRPLRRVLVSIASVILLLPILGLSRNYFECDRSDNYVPYDYAWDLLQSAEPKALLFTNGDNDTFPLWCLQEVYGVRRDVTVINLSLANTQWYIKQIQSTMGVDLGWSDEQIDSLHEFRVPDEQTLRSRGQVVTSRVYDYLNTSMTHLDSLFALYPAPYNVTFRYRNMVIDNLIYRYLGKRPIDFAVTTSQDARRFLGRSISNRLALVGLVWRVESEASGMRADMDASYDFFMNPERFRARGVNDPSVYKDDNALDLTENLATSCVMVADTLRRSGDTVRAEKLTLRTVELLPQAEDAVAYLGQIYADQGKPQAVLDLMSRAPVEDSLLLKAPLGYAYRAAGQTTEAEQVLAEVLRADPKHRGAFESMLQMYFESKQYTKLFALLGTWLQHNPDDRRVRAMYDDLRARMAGDSSGS